MKVLCYGVRDVEEPIFESSNKAFGYDIKCVPDYLNTPETAEMAKVLMLLSCVVTALPTNRISISTRNSVFSMY